VSRAARRIGLIATAYVAAQVVGLGASGAQARELIYGSWVSPKHGLNRLALPHFFKGVEKATKGEITWKLLAGGQLVSGRTTPQGIRDNMIDAGFGIAPYVPNRLPATNMIFSTYVFGGDIAAAAGAAMETVLLNCPACLAEHRRNNAIPLAGYDAAPFLLMCRDDVRGLADLKGRKVRASGAGVYLMRQAGATPVAMSPAQATTALQRGTIDCVHGAGNWIRAYGYGDIVKSVILHPTGISGPAMALYFNRKTWKSLTPGQQAAHLAFAPAVIARSVMEMHYAETEEVLADARKRGVRMHAGGAEFDRLIARFKTGQRRRNIANARRFGVKSAEAIMAAFEAALVKWRGLSKGIGRDAAKFEAALKREIYDKVDHARF